MPTLTTDRGDEINVSSRLVARMAERMHRMTPDRRVRYLVKAQRRLDTAQPSRNAAAALLASRVLSRSLAKVGDDDCSKRRARTSTIVVVAIVPALVDPDPRLF